MTSTTRHTVPRPTARGHRARVRQGLAASLGTVALAVAALGLAGAAQAGELGIDLTVGQARSQSSGTEGTTLGVGVMLGYHQPDWWVTPELGYNTRSDLFYTDNSEIDLGIGHAWALGATTLHLGGGLARLDFSNYTEKVRRNGSYLRAGLSWRVAQRGGFRMGVEARWVNTSQPAGAPAFQDGSYSEVALLLGWRI
ncbi:MAG: hypothetical protein RL375_3136 [Pseudomonadota bacterium]